MTFDAYQASSAQKRLFLVNQLYGENIVYNMPNAWVIEGCLEVARVEASIRQLIQRHETLRTCFATKDGEVLQKVYEELDFNLEYIQRPEGDIDALAQEFIRPFDLNRVPLWRAKLVQLAEDRQLLLFDIHHTVADGVSLGVFVNDLLSFYNGRELEDMEYQYVDFTMWQNEMFEEELIEKQGKYWLDVFSGEIPVLDLPYDFPRGDSPLLEGGTVDIPLDPGLTARVNRLAVDCRTTLFTVLLGAYNILLSRYSRQEDIVVGCPISGRSHKEFESIIGMFVNTLALRNRIEPGITAKEFISGVSQHVFAAFNNQDYPFEMLVEQLVPQRQVNRNPLMDTFFALQNFDQDIEAVDKENNRFKIVPHVLENETAKFDLSLTAFEADDRLMLEFEYAASLFKKSTVERIGRNFIHLLNSVCDKPGQMVGDIDFLDEKEKQKILEFATGKTVEFDEEKTVVDLLCDRAEQSPDAVALVKENSNKGIIYKDTINITFRELDLLSSRYSLWLRNRGIGTGSIAGFMVERSLTGIIALLGTVKAGAAYMPMAADYPLHRVQYMLADSSARILMLSSNQSLSFDSDLYKNAARMSVNVHDSKESNIIRAAGEELDVVFLDSTGEETAPASPEITTGDSMYIIYTSGTTGKPKGVVVEHRNLANMSAWFGDKYSVGVGLYVLQMSDITFDPSAEQIFSSLSHGATLFLLDKHTLLDQELLRRFIEKYLIEMIGFVPSLLNVLLSEGKKLNSLRYILSGGERLDNVLKDEILQQGYTLYNHYGPTETTIDALIEYCTERPVTLGHPVPNGYCLILDPYGNPAPIGAPGELYVGGKGVTRGYLNRPELTAECFLDTDGHRLRTQTFTDGFFQSSEPDHGITNEAKVAEPPQVTLNKSFAGGSKGGAFTKASPLVAEGIFYKSGDLGRYLDDGRIEFLGRIDHQVKVRGFRVELGEIESCLLGIDGVREVVVLALGEGEKYLCAYVVPKRDGDGRVFELDKEEIKAILGESLPVYMVPSYFVFLDEMPLNQNKKIDRRALPEPELGAAVSEPPRTVVEKSLAEIWVEILNLPEGEEGYAVGIDDNFFELGGHSLKITQLAAAIKKRFDAAIPLGELFKNATIRGLAGLLSGAGESDEIEPMEKREYYPLSSAQERLYVVCQLNTGSVAYNMPSAVRLEGPLEFGRLEKAFGELIKRHESFRTSFVMINEVPVQHIREEAAVDIRVLEESGEMDAQGLDAVIRRFVRPFDLSQAPLLSVGLMRESENSHILLTDMHHIVSDGLSMAILVKEFIRFYNQEPSEPLVLHYRDFSMWQKREMMDGILKKQQEYWLNRFSGKLPCLELPTDQPRSDATALSMEGEEFNFEIDGSRFDRINRLVEETGVTMFQFLLAIYTILLSRYGRQEDITVGCPIAGRTHPDLELLVGMFVNMLPIRSRAEGESTFLEFLSVVKQDAFEAFEHQAYQFEDLVAALGLQGDTSRNPIFDTAFAYDSDQDETETAITPGVLSVKYIDFHNRKSIYDLILRAYHRPDRLSMMFQFKTALWNLSTIEKYAERYLEIIDQVIAEPSKPLNQVQFKSELIAVESTGFEEDGDDFNF